MKSEANFFINNPIFVKFKRRFDFQKWRSVLVLKSIHVNERIVEVPFAIQAVAGLAKGAEVLDLGCTESPLPLQLAALGYHVTGFDFRPYPYTHPHLHFVQGDITLLPFGEEKFDAVFSISTLEHIGIGFYEDPKEAAQADKKAVAQVARILKSGGLFILTAPYGVGGQTAQQRIYDEKSLSALLSPFHIETLRYFKSQRSDGAHGNTWVEITKDQAASVASPQATMGVCLVIAQKK